VKPHPMRIIYEITEYLFLREQRIVQNYSSFDNLCKRY